MWEDIQDVFPDAVRLQCGKRAVGFMADDNGNRLQPLRIEHQPRSSIQVILGSGSSSRTISSGRTTVSSPPPPSLRTRSSFDYFQVDSYGQSAPRPLSPSFEREMATRRFSSQTDGWFNNNFGQVPTTPTQQYSNRLPLSSQFPQLQHSHEKFEVPGQMTMNGDQTLRQGRDFSTVPRSPQYYRQSKLLSDNGLELAIPQAGSASIRRDSVSEDVKKRFRNSVVLYESFLQCLQDGQTAQADLIRNNFLEHFMTLDTEMAKDQELLQQMQGMQRVMMDLQQQALDRLFVVQTRVQAILTKNYELHENMIPKLFIVLPKDSARWDPTNIHQNKLRLYFLCECGTARHQINSQIPHHIHLAKHGGYDIENPAEFFKRYGSYVSCLLQMLKYGFSTAGYAVPALVSPRGLGGADRTKYSSENHAYNLEPEVNMAIDYLSYLYNEDISSSLERHGNGPSRRMEDLGALEGPDLKQLETFLKRKDTEQTLGNLYRVMNDEGYAKWLCLDHFRETYNASTIKTLSDVIAMNRGTFNEFKGRIEVSLASASAASQVYKALEQSKFIQELKVVLRWEASLNDFKAFRDAMLKSNIATLHLMRASSNNAAVDILSRGKKSDPLWQVMMSPKMQTFSLHDYTGFFSRVTIPATTTNLRFLKVVERIDWKKDGPKVVELLENCPHLRDLRLNSNEIDAAYTAIKSINYDFCTLENLLLDGGESGLKGESNGLQARFKKGVPASMDLIVSDMSSPLLKDTRVLHALHIRPGLHVRVDIDSQLLTGVISRNPSLTKVIIQCEASEFLRLHIAVKDALVDEEGSALHTLRLYGGRNQLSVKDLQGNTAVELELLSINMPREVIDTLLRVYGTRLTKISIEADVLKVLFDTAHLGGAEMLRHIEIKSSCVKRETLYGLQFILERSQSTLSHLSIVMDVTWDATTDGQGNSTCADLADFVAEIGPRWSKIIVKEADVTAWKKALDTRGFTVPDKVLSVVSNAMKASHSQNFNYAVNELFKNH
ncbi:hypothetical protein BGZ58_004526 [Dissophora ornata]|nr:hypothetical protein BGZ58_004526 [Dissophora ornata]